KSRISKVVSQLLVIAFILSALCAIPVRLIERPLHADEAKQSLQRQGGLNPQSCNEECYTSDLGSCGNGLECIRKYGYRRQFTHCRRVSHFWPVHAFAD